MEYWKRREIEARNRLRAALDKPLPANFEAYGEEEFDPWDLLDGCTPSYSSDIDDLAIEVLKAVRDRKTFDLLDGENALAANLFMHMLADWLCDYGVSPRGVFPAFSVEDMWQELIDKWEAFAKGKWSD